ncbi:MAG TPA: tetratricopeptide repeat protein [Anaeromyxobacter sp.]|nr:tetratricopeptide repeat protein [Anaeromyxobacter sp.]
MPDLPRPPGREARRWAAAVAAAALALYLPTVRHGFAMDDAAAVVRNAHVRSLARAPEIFRTNDLAGAGVRARVYRPLTTLTLALNHAAAGLAPWSYHLVNAALHALAAVLLLALALALGLPPLAAGTAALLFAVHPIHVEAVSNVAGRKDVLATVLVLAALVAHRRAARGGGAWLAGPALAAAAMLSKEIGIATPALAVLADLAVPAHPAGDRAALRRRLRLYAAHAAVAAAYLLLFAAVTRGAGGPPPFVDNPAAHAGAAARVMTAIAVVGKGLGLLAFPVGQSPDYSYDALPVVARAGDPRLLAAVAALLAWAAAGALARRRAPVVLLGLAWYLVALLPTSNLLFPIGTVFGERLLYLPSAGAALAAGAAVGALAPRLAAAAPARRVAAGALGAVAVAALSVATLRYSEAWSSDRTLIPLAAQRVPRSVKIRQGNASALAAAGRTEDALAEIDAAAAIWADARTQALRAGILARLGRAAEAEEAAARALALDPGEFQAAYAKGGVARDAGRLDEAEAWFRRTVALRPDFPEAWSDLAACRYLAGRPAEALPLARRALELSDGLANAWYVAALSHKGVGDAARARAAFQRFVETAGPGHAAQAAAVRDALARGALP